MRFGSIEELGEGYGFRKVRVPLGVTAFGVNVDRVSARVPGLPPLSRHAGRALLRALGLGPHRGRGRGADPRARRAAARRVDDATQGVERERDATTSCCSSIGGKGGYVERDGHMVDEADIERRAAVRSRGRGSPRLRPAYALKTKSCASRRGCSGR